MYFDTEGLSSSLKLSAYKLFEMTANNIPGNIAVKFKNEDISYYELLNKVSHIADVLKTENVNRGDTVAIMMKRSIDTIIAILAILKVGAAYLPIDPEYPEQRIKFMLSDSGAPFLLTHSAMGYQMNNLKVLCIDKLYDYGISEKIKAYEEPKHDDLAYIIYTSGSTGKPKGVMIENKSVVNFINGITEVIDFSADKKILALTTISFDIFVLEILLPLTKGLTVILADENTQKNPKLLADIIIDNNIDMVQMTPSRMQLLAIHDKELKCLRNLKEIMIGGEPLPQTLLEKIKANTCARIYNMYGPTETTVWSTVSDLTEKNCIDIGKPILNTQIYILDENNGLILEDAEGELCIGGSGLARGYFNRPELTAERFILNPFISGERIYKTGDMARWLPDGNIKYIGRIDNQVKIRGHRIELEEIETVLLEYESIKQAVVAAWQGNEDIKYLCAYYLSDEEIISAALREYLTRKLPEYMIPAYFIRFDNIPQTPNGKIDRKALREPETILPKAFELKQGTHYNESKSDDDTNAEFKIKEIIRENIDIPISMDSIDLNSNLADLDINSITYVKIVVSIEVEFGFEFEDNDLDANRFPTFGSLVAYVEDRSSI